MKTIIALLLFCLALSPIPDIREARSDLSLYECPSLECDVLSFIPEGDLMTGIEDSQKLVSGIVWLKVVYDGLKGWVNSRGLKRYYPPIQGGRFA